MAPVLSADTHVRYVSKADGDAENTIVFLKTVVAHNMDSTCWQWEFESFPESTVLTILKSHGKTGGTQFMLPVPLSLDGTGVTSGKCENSYVSPEFKGTGWFAKLFSLALDEAKKRELKVLWAFTPATKVYGQKLGFTVFPDSMQAFRGIWGKPTLQYFSHFPGNRLYNLTKYFFYRLRAISFGNRVRSLKRSMAYDQALAAYEVTDTPKQPDDLQRLYHRLREQYPGLVHIDPTPKYMDWRIRQNPNLTYVTQYFYTKGELAGYYIYALKDQAVNLTDLTFSDKKVADMLFCHLLDGMRRSGKIDFHYFANKENPINSHIFQLLEKMGGVITPAGDLPFVFRLFGEVRQGQQEITADSPFLADPRNWYLNGMWTEGYNY